MNRAIETEITRHLRTLCHEIGCRPTGSPPNRLAAAYIASAFQSAGLDIEELTFPCPDWRDEGTLLEMDGLPLAAFANAFSPPCDVAAPGCPSVRRPSWSRRSSPAGSASCMATWLAAP